jgi:hypothetical protein
VGIVYDAIVIGTGAGGGTLALHLARAGKKILILERGPFMPQEKLNWDTSAVFLDNRYHTKETWRDKDGKDLHPQQAYFTIFYIAFQFAGAILGVGFTALFIGRILALPSIRYVVTVPGVGGPPGAFAAETFMATVLMGVVLWLSNRPKVAGYTSYCVGALITIYVLLFAPVSGFSINPARSIGSAVFAHLWSSMWIYFVAPILGMLLAAEIYIRFQGRDGIRFAKLHPDSDYPCPFLCNYPGHHDAQPSTVSASNLGGNVNEVARRDGA